ncbi:MAG: preprotein translocase subunit YajC [Endomicrobiales bacterium]|jgi:preprotein translocase subunit YajC
MKTVVLCSGLLLSSVMAYADPAAGGANAFGSFFPLIIIFVIFYFFLIRPQQKKAKEHQTLLNALKKDDKVLTSGGIYGTVVQVKGEIVEVKIAENVKVQVAKSAITSVITPGQNNDAVVTPEIVK